MLETALTAAKDGVKSCTGMHKKNPESSFVSDLLRLSIFEFSLKRIIPLCLDNAYTLERLHLY